MLSRVLWLLWLLGLGGCAAHGLRCDGALSPINNDAGSTASKEDPASKQLMPAP
jgi:hypothetical protein